MSLASLTTLSGERPHDRRNGSLTADYIQNFLLYSQDSAFFTMARALVDYVCDLTIMRVLANLFTNCWSSYAFERLRITANQLLNSVCAGPRLSSTWQELYSMGLRLCFHDYPSAPVYLLKVDGAMLVRGQLAVCSQRLVSSSNSPRRTRASLSFGVEILGGLRLRPEKYSQTFFTRANGAVPRFDSLPLTAG